MSDLISRADAIKDVETWTAVDEHERHLQKNVIEWLKEFPPAEHGANLAEVGTDCISRRSAIDAIRKVIGDNRSISVCEAVKKLPPIQPKKGRWIESKGQQILMQNAILKGETWRVCSECGAGHMIGHKYECDKAYHETHHNFCPNCGADMRGEQNG